MNWWQTLIAIVIVLWVAFGKSRLAQKYRNTIALFIIAISIIMLLVKIGVLR